MYNDKFTSRYENIPIAKFSYLSSNITLHTTFTFPQLHKEFEIILIKEGTANIAKVTLLLHLRCSSRVTFFRFHHQDVSLHGLLSSGIRFPVLML